MFCFVLSFYSLSFSFSTFSWLSHLMLQISAEMFSPLGSSCSLPGLIRCFFCASCAVSITASLFLLFGSKCFGVRRHVLFTFAWLVQPLCSQIIIEQMILEKRHSVLWGCQNIFPKCRTLEPNTSFAEIHNMPFLLVLLTLKKAVQKVHWMTLLFHLTWFSRVASHGHKCGSWAVSGRNVQNTHILKCFSLCKKIIF